MLGRCAVGRRAPVGVVTAPPAPLRRSPASVSPAFALLNSGASPWSVTSACTRFAVQARGAVTVPAAQERKGSHSTASTSGTAAGSAPTHVPRQSGVRDGAWTKLDGKLVADAQRDATTAGAPSSVAKGGVLLGMSVDELRDMVVAMGAPQYRGKQIFDKLMQGAATIDDLNQLPKAFRQELRDAGVVTGRSTLYSSSNSADGTRKFLCQLSDGHVVETVGIPFDAEHGQRLTACISSQVGCPMRCTFCATGKGGFARNLKPHEIVDQVLTVQQQFGARVNNVVFMGMGEPLLNVRAIVEAVRILNLHLGIGGRSITISTVGVPNAIAMLAEHKLQATLAVSVHAPNQALRERLVPSAKVYPLQALMLDCQAYFKATSRRVTFEYTLMHGVNNGVEHAAELATLIRNHRMATHVNLIPWNPVADSGYERPSKSSVDRFRKALEAANVSVTVRATRGLDAAAACGQLRNEFQAKQNRVPAAAGVAAAPAVAVSA